MSSTSDVLLIGHGIAGAVLAATLEARGLSVHVIDRKRAGNASLAAVGLVNPIVLRRDVPSWRAAELLPLAEQFYQRSAAGLWHPTEVVKVFPTPNEAAQWQRALNDPASAPFIDAAPRADVDAALDVPHGYGTVHQAAWLDVPAFLAQRQEQLTANGCFTGTEVDEAAIERFSDGVRIGDHRARWLVRCEGPFAAVPGLVQVKGEALLVRIPGLKLERAVHRGVFILPVGAELYRVGATFKWDEVWNGPTGQARHFLLDSLRRIIDRPVDVVEHVAGVRPTSKDRRPIMGITGPREVVLNGLGSRGVLLAPWCATHLIDHLFEGAPLDPEVDVARFR